MYSKMASKLYQGQLARPLWYPLGLIHMQYTLYHLLDGKKAFLFWKTLKDSFLFQSNTNMGRTYLKWSVICICKNLIQQIWTLCPRPHTVNSLPMGLHYYIYAIKNPGWMSWCLRHIIQAGRLLHRTFSNGWPSHPIWGSQQSVFTYKDLAKIF